MFLYFSLDVIYPFPRICMMIGRMPYGTRGLHAGPKSNMNYACAVRSTSSAHPHVTLLIIPFRSFSYHARVLLIALCSTTKRPSSSQHKTTYASQSQAILPSPPLSFVFSFSYRSRLTPNSITDTKATTTWQDYYVAAVRSFSLSPFSFPIMHLHLLFVPHHWYPKVAATIQNLD